MGFFIPFFMDFIPVQEDVAVGAGKSSVPFSGDVALLGQGQLWGCSLLFIPFLFQVL